MRARCRGSVQHGSRPEQLLWDGVWPRLVKVHIPGRANPNQYLHSDWQGTALAGSGPTGAGLIQNYPPRPWGADGPGVGPLSWLGNHGYWYEGSLARPMHYVRARWYPDVGAANGGGTGWLSADPLGFEGLDWNLYRYVMNGPTVDVDPSGELSCRICQEICKTGHSPALADCCAECWKKCTMKCSEWGNPKKAPLCNSDNGETPVFITCYKTDPKHRGQCAVYCSRKWCRSHHSNSPGSNRPLCDVRKGVQLNIPGFGTCKVKNGGCGQSPGRVPNPNNWLDFPDCKGGLRKCWVCLKLPADCNPKAKPAYKSPRC